MLGDVVGRVLRYVVNAVVSQKSANNLSPRFKAFAEGKTLLPSIVEFNAENRSILFANGREE